MTEIVATRADRRQGDPDALEVVSPQSPGVVFWTQMRKSPLAIAGGVVLTIFYLLALFAPFVAPYPQEEMDRAKYFHPPQALHWVRADGSFSLRPLRARDAAGRHGQLRVRRGSGERAAGAVLRARLLVRAARRDSDRTSTCSASMRPGASSCSAAIRSGATCCRACCTARRSR